MQNRKGLHGVALAGEGLNEDAKRVLQLYGHEVITLPTYDKLPSPLSSHADMLLTGIGDDLISYADYCDRAAYAFSDLSLLLPYGTRLSFVDEIPKAEYPFDAGLNMLVIGNTLYAKTDTASPGALDIARKRGMRIRKIKQGYPACTVLRLNDGAAITADRGMAKILSQDGIRVTLINDGGISLPPYPYGFIGGCGGVFDGRVYLNGSVDEHPSGEIIKRAIECEGLELITLHRGALADIGGIIFTERKL